MKLSVTSCNASCLESQMKTSDERERRGRGEGERKSGKRKDAKLVDRPDVKECEEQRTEGREERPRSKYRKMRNILKGNASPRRCKRMMKQTQNKKKVT